MQPGEVSVEHYRVKRCCGERVQRLDTVTDNGSAEIIVSDQQNDVTLVTVVNEATWAPGTFGLSKTVTGVLPTHPGAPRVC